MSSLNITEKGKLEKLLIDTPGYISNFSDKSFGVFFADGLKIDIHDKKYQASGTSKANKLREFWRLETDYLVGRSILLLVEHEEERINDAPARFLEKRRLLEPCKAIAHRLMSGDVRLDDLKQISVVFDAKHLADQIRRIEQSVHSDPALAIGTAKELIETCCKTIMAERGKPVTGASDIPKLTKATLKELKLIPEGVPDETRGGDVIKRLLQNLGTIGNSLAELRGLYGTGHGKHGKASGLSSRHAKLAVGAASTLVTFLFETHEETINKIPIIT
jgi:hypothetical protein